MEMLREKPTGPRLLVVDDQPIVRAGLVTLFQKTGAVEARGAEPKEAANVALVFRPAVCLLDAALPSLNAFAVAQAVRSAAAEVRLLFLDEHFNPIHLREAIRAGATGYWTKQASFEQLLLAVRAVAGSQRSFAPEATAMLDTLCCSRNHHQEPVLPVPPELHKLSRREFEVFICLAHGLDLRECAARLALSVNTVDNHKTRLMRKLGVHRGVDLVLLAARYGLLGDGGTLPRGLPANLDHARRSLRESGQAHQLANLQAIL